MFENHKKNQTTALVAAAVAMAISAAARAADPQPVSVLDEVIVTGTRATGVALSESPTPVQLVSAEALQATGKSDLMGALAATIPSFQAQAYGADMANQTLQARLRGLSPNHALVLVDGKRRHTTSNLSVLGGAFTGGAGVDLNFIPVAAIDHIEVLTDGAAATYGTDAIAGVINIITKKGDSGGSINTTYGGYMDGGGETVDVSANAGFAPAEGAYFNVTAGIQKHDHSDRGAPDVRVWDYDTNEPRAGLTYPDTNVSSMKDFPNINHIFGDAKSQLKLISVATGFNFSEAAEVYFFGTYGLKTVSSFENVRLPFKAVYDPDGSGGAAPTYLYPFGFQPKEAGDEKDHQFTLGLSGEVLGGVTYDLSTSLGQDTMRVETIDAVNVDLYADTGASPTSFYDGTFISRQWTTSLDLSKEFDVGIPLTVAGGAEYREEMYQIAPGDPYSYYKVGAASFPGYKPSSIIGPEHERYQKGIYLNLVLKPLEAWTIDIAGRYEDYSDFGNKTIGKFTSRYDITDGFAVRGTYSTGFRAPTLAEEYYSATEVGPTSTSGLVAPNSPTAIGIIGHGLLPETSKQFSAGIVLKPMPNFLATLDGYQIKLKNRIAKSSALTGWNGQLVSQDVINIVQSVATIDPAAYSPSGFVGFTFFTNGVDTTTKGLDLVLSYKSDYDWGGVTWTAGATYTDTNVTKTATAPALFFNPAYPQYNASLFDPGSVSTFEDFSPKFVLNLGATAKLGSFDIALREIIYGPVKELNYAFYADGNDYWSKEKTTPITNLDVTYHATQGLAFSVGASNLFNKYPAKQNADMLALMNSDTNQDYSSVAKYINSSPFGINGGYYYGKVSFSF